MLNLIKKEIALCMHPTAFIFLFFAVLVFVPNYPYEVIFFFSCLSIFFSCMMTRENGDIAFSCALPVKKRAYSLCKNAGGIRVTMYHFIACRYYRRNKRRGFACGAICQSSRDIGESCFGRQRGNFARHIQSNLLPLLFQKPRQNRSPFRNRCSCYIFANQRFYRFALGNAALFYNPERPQFRKYRRKTRGTCYRYCCLCCFICCKL